MGNAAGAAGLSALMAGADGREWFARAAERYRESWEDAPPGSWGRPIGALKARILAGDWDGAADEARWALDAGAGGVGVADRPLRRGARRSRARRLDDARVHADTRARTRVPERGRGRARVHRRRGRRRLHEAVEDVLESFETRTEYLEDIPVADTVLVLQALAAAAGWPPSSSRRCFREPPGLWKERCRIVAPRDTSAKARVRGQSLDTSHGAQIWKRRGAT